MKIMRALKFGMMLLMVFSVGSEAQIINDSINYQVALDNSTGVPGAVVRVPVKLKNQEALAGFLLRIEYDTSLLEPVELGPDQNIIYDSLEMTGRGMKTISIDSTYPGLPRDTVYNTYSFHSPSDDSVNTEALFIMFIPIWMPNPNMPHLASRPHIPPELNAPSEILNLLFRVKEAAVPGQTAEVRVKNYTGPLFEPRFVQLVDSLLNRTIIPGSGPIYDSSLLLVLPGICGDLNYDGGVNIADVGATVSFLYRGVAPPVTSRFADVNNDGVVNILDITYLINYLFRTGPAPLGGCLG